MTTMRYSLILLSLLCLALVSCQEQPPLPAAPPGTILFGEKYDEVASDILEDADGNFLILGGKEDKSSGEWDIMLVKVDGTGREMWTRIIEDDDQNSYGRHIVKTQDGYGMVTYEQQSTGSFYGGINISLERYDEDFQLQGRAAITGQGAYNGTNDPVAELFVTPSGGFIVESFGYSETSIQQFSSSGVPSEPINVINGSLGAREARTLIPVAGGGYVMAQSNSLSSNQVLVYSFDEEGNPLSDIQEYFLNQSGQVIGLAVLPDSTYLVTTWSYDYSTASVGGNILIHLDPDGTVLDQINITNQAYFSKVYPRADGSLILIGNSQEVYGPNGLEAPNTVVVYKESLQGDEQVVSYGGDSGDGMRDVVLTSDGRYAIVGFTRSYGAGGSDATLIFHQP